MRLSDYCSAQDIDRAIAVTIESFVGSQKISAKKSLARAFAKYTLGAPGASQRSREPRSQPRGGRRGVTAAA